MLKPKTVLLDERYTMMTDEQLGRMVRLIAQFELSGPLDASLVANLPYMVRGMFYANEDGSYCPIDYSAPKPKPKPPQEAFDLTDRLIAIIRQQRALQVGPNKRLAWAEAFDKLERLDGVSYQRQTAALNWYEQHYQDQYCPVIESGKAFREKYVKLQEAYRRSKQTTRQADALDILRSANA